MRTFTALNSLYEASREEKIAQIKKDFEGKVPAEIVDLIVKSDTTAGLDFVKPLLNLYKRSPYETTEEELARLLPLFTSLKNKKKLENPDLNSYKTFDQLRDIENKNYKVLYDKSPWKIVEILTKAGAVSLGDVEHTNYCTARPDGSYYESTYGPDHGRLFVLLNDKKVYPKAGDLYSQYFISHDKTNIQHLVADGTDRTPADTAELARKYPDLKKFFLSTGWRPYEGIEFKGRQMKYSLDEERGIYTFQTITIEDSELKSLKEFQELMDKPYEVLGDFDCSNNQLTDLVGGPVSVGGKMVLSKNPLKSLAGLPSKIKSLELSGCQVKSLENLPGDLEELDVSDAPIKNIDISNCSELKKFSGKDLKTLSNVLFHDHHTERVSISGTSLKTMVGFPKKVNYLRVENSKISTLDGCPEVVLEEIHVESCDTLKSLSGTLRGAKNLYIKDIPATTLVGLGVRKTIHAVFESIPIKNLDGAPEEILGILLLRKLPELTTLTGSTKTVRDLDVNGCPKLKSTKGITVTGKTSGMTPKK